MNTISKNDFARVAFYHVPSWTINYADCRFVPKSQQSVGGQKEKHAATK